MFQDHDNKESQFQTEFNLGLMKDKRDSLYESIRDTEGCQDSKLIDEKRGLRGFFAKK
tara:strand:- start:956 stop:1129 length:174 start_codon:yes stop_codon:yes gene_type:complete